MHKELDKFTILDCYSQFSNVTNYETNLNASNGIMDIRTTNISSRFYKKKTLNQNALSTMATLYTLSLWNVAENYKFQYVDGLLIHLSYKDLGLTEWTNENSVKFNNKIANYMKNNYGTEYFIWQLATPENIEITDTTLINQLNEISQALSKKGTTIISQNNDDLPFYLDVIALTK